tara:strand:+ start:236 stop:418 length:183 start_codon:yes stop_codon:yes gene_type:complete
LFGEFVWAAFVAPRVMIQALLWAEQSRWREVDPREVINGVRYPMRSGCGRRVLPIHFGPW